MKLKGFCLLGFLFISAQVLAYPNYIGYGYTSCLTCHYNPFGNGPLNDYGRALGATLISDRLMYSKTTSEEEIANRSGFLYMPPKIKWLRPSLNYRGLWLKNSYSSDAAQTEIIHMQASANVVLKFLENDKLIIVLEGGYAPDPRSDQTEGESNYRSREHYIGYKINQKWGIYAGLMDKVFGIRLIDHIAFSRAITNLTMNDQVHGFLLHGNMESFEFGVQAFVGNLAQTDTLRQTGMTSQFEYTVNQRTRVGASAQYSQSEFEKRYLAAFHGRVGFGKGSSVQAELGQVTEGPADGGQDNSTARYMTMQNHLLLKRGLFSLATFEFLQSDVDSDDKVIRLGPGIQYFPLSGFELRADIYNSRVFSETNVSEDNWDLTAQLHLWF